MFFVHTWNVRQLICWLMTLLHIHISIRGNLVYLNTGGEWKWGSFGASLNSLRCDSHPENRKHMSIIYGEKKQTHHWQKIAKRRKTRCTWKKAKNSSIQNRSSESSLYTCLAVTVTDVHPSRPMPVGQRWHTVAPSVLVKVPSPPKLIGTSSQGSKLMNLCGPKETQLENLRELIEYIGCLWELYFTPNKDEKISKG